MIMMNLKTRSNRIDSAIDELFESRTGQIANQNVVHVSNFAKNEFGIDMDRTAQIYMGVTMDGSKLIESESLDYLEYCENKLGIGDHK